MTPQQAMTLRPHDIVFNTNMRETARVLHVARGGRRIFIAGKFSQHYLPPNDLLLVYTAAEVPADFSLGLVYGEGEAEMRRMIAEREAHEAKDQENKEEENDHGDQE